ncbi:hypothetical protein [Marinobacterium stanieri]|uniref:hypothetical protein n=1 Tax=Marinobacterium stanieri TaxID=49186 RepID=UPI001303D683|nr:hypothetical protein [Marinobacterium stanieri]
MAKRHNHHSKLNTLVLITVLSGFFQSSPGINIETTVNLVQVTTEQHPHSLAARDVKSS